MPAIEYSDVGFRIAYSDILSCGFNESQRCFRCISNTTDSGNLFRERFLCVFPSQILMRTSYADFRPARERVPPLTFWGNGPKTPSSWNGLGNRDLDVGSAELRTWGFPIPNPEADFVRQISDQPEKEFYPEPSSATVQDHRPLGTVWRNRDPELGSAELRTWDILKKGRASKIQNWRDETPLKRYFVPSDVAPAKSRPQDGFPLV
jgi:hypothetical protein